MVDNSITLCKPNSGRFLVMRQSRQALSPPSEAPFECCCRHLHPSPRDMTPQLHVISLALKQKPAARGTRAPRLPSSVDGFSRLPWPVSAAGSAAPDACHLAFVAARAPRAARHGDAQNGSRLATTLDWRAVAGTAVQWPRFDERAPLSHDGPSDSLAQ